VGSLHEERNEVMIVSGYQLYKLYRLVHASPCATWRCLKRGKLMANEFANAPSAQNISLSLLYS
jgi:hypothetical protein